MGDFNAENGREKKYQNIVGKYSAHKRTNKNGERLINVCKNYKSVLRSTAFKYLPRKSKTWRHPNPLLREYQLDFVAIARKVSKEILKLSEVITSTLIIFHL